MRSGLVRFLVGHEALTEGHRAAHRVKHWLTYHPVMAGGPWPVKRLDTVGDVEQWLGLGTSDLEWLADRKGLEHSAPDARMQNYSYRWIGHRLIEAPKQQLMHVQRKVLHEILDAIPPHEAAHGFRRGRSVLTHARLHAACAVVARFDLRAFFTHIAAARAYAVFRTAGYPEQVAITLTGLCTNRTNAGVLRAAPFALRQLLADWHLPQGAPTSPALANLAAWWLDVRLTELSRRFGATYSRYADDLVFSGDVLFSRPALQRAVEEIVSSEGFALNSQKTRWMTASRRQLVTGAIVNAGVNVVRGEYDRLKATLHNCARHGIDSQSRGLPRFRAHLEGRVAWVEHLNPKRGARLRQMLMALR